MNNTIKTLGLVGLLTAVGVVSFNRAQKTPFEMNGADYRGYKISREDGIEMVYFGDKEESIGIVNDDRKFNASKAYNQGGAYNVSGYTQFGTTYATNIAPIKAESPINVESD